jgi:hypothetical protein
MHREFSKLHRFGPLLIYLYNLTVRCLLIRDEEDVFLKLQYRLHVRAVSYDSTSRLFLQSSGMEKYLQLVRFENKPAVQ